MNAINRVIQNVDALATTPARSALLAIAEAGYQAIATPRVVAQSLTREGDLVKVGAHTYNLAEYEHVYVLGVGKCSLDAAPTIADVLKDNLTEGLLLDVRSGDAPPRMRVLAGTHPYPSAQNAENSRELLEFSQKAREHDLVIALISGGGSSLLCLPHSHTPLEETNLLHHLFKAGATIADINIIRKHISRLRGGNIAAQVFPATLAVLLFSDVPGDDIATIASGPTVLDSTTCADAAALLERYHVERIGFTADHCIETPKDAALFASVQHELVLTNRLALEAMAKTAQDLGYLALVRSTELQGDVRVLAKDIVAELHSAKPRTVLLYGGETTVHVSGPGKGGRNEELALSALLQLAPDELLLALASDGRDNTDFAGGIADQHTRELASVEKLTVEEFLFTNDSYSFFHTLQQGVTTGYTGSNVADLIIGMKYGPSRPL